MAYQLHLGVSMILSRVLFFSDAYVVYHQLRRASDRNRMDTSASRTRGLFSLHG